MSRTNRSDRAGASSVMRKFVLFGLVFLLIGAASAQSQKPRQSVTPSPATRQESEPPLLPLTEAERALNLLLLLSQQPDYMAEERFFDVEAHGGFSAKRQVARQGLRQMIDTGFVKILLEPGKEFRLDDKSKTYEEIPVRENLILGNGRPLDVSLLVRQEGLRLSALGTQMIDGHKCLKIEAKLRNQEAQIFLYAATDLNYLVIAAEVIKSPRRSMQRLQNISLQVPAHLLEIPPDYHPLPKFKWVRVASAQILYDGKEQKDGSVFRSEDERLLFVTVEEPHPNSGLPLAWHYVVYLSEQKVEIGYRGMLLTKQGDWAWATNESEAISNGENKPKKDWSPCQNRKCPKTIVGPNFVQFASVYYEDRQSLIRVSW